MSGWAQLWAPPHLAWASKHMFLLSFQLTLLDEVSPRPLSLLRASCLFTIISLSFPPSSLKPCRFSPLYSTAVDGAEDNYVPMRPSTSPSAPGSDCSPDGYIPMSPTSAAFTFPVVSTEKVTSPLPELPSDLEPPPVNRDLKPRRKCKARPKEQPLSKCPGGDTGGLLWVWPWYISYVLV